MDRNGNLVVDANGDPVTVPVTPTENADLSADDVVRLIHGQDGEIGAEITVKPK